MIGRAAEQGLRRLLEAWSALSVDAKAVGALGALNWLLYLNNQTIVQATSDELVWKLFPGPFGPLYLVVLGAVALAYPLRHLRQGARFTTRDRVLHVAALVVLFALVPAAASIVLREASRPYAFVHDGAIMVEEAARKLLAGKNPYVADYLDTPLFFWPMVNNPALYHFTYFPFLFLVTIPFVAAFDAAGLFWDQRYLYLPAYVATIAIAPTLVRGADRRIALAALVALNPQLLPFVAEGRNDYFVLAFFFAGLALLARDRTTLAALLFAVAAASKLHAGVFLPFLAVYVMARARPATLGAAAHLLWRTFWPAGTFLLAAFLPFLINDLGAFWDDVVRYNAGGAAWSYPISGLGFSALLLRLGVIEFPQQEFPFAVFQLAVAVPLAGWWLVRLWRDPSLATLLAGYALTLLAFLFFGRYFHGNYLGYIAAVATPILFLRPLPARQERRPPRPAALAAPRGLPSAR
ncbi:MAG TPA: glycosyltransferase 87 family protein [Candidatus Limnocylindrales bacterium]|nr:glycosyltransferase 87 family protein [Candidatus Limnocylindrales bacterium]